MRPLLQLTPSAYLALLPPTPRTQLKKVLDVWGDYLRSPESASVLDTDSESWFGPDAVESLEHVANLNGQTSHKFADMFQCDPAAKHHGFTSWDDFFTRLFRPGIRDVASPDDDNVVANACESKVYKVARNVHARDRFWVKGQPYSVLDMLAFDETFANRFAGGTVYQAFLSALSYHRWHSPVSGTIKKAYVVPGTYYSEPIYEDFSSSQEAPLDGENISQEYISAVATRSIIFIEADNKKLGVVAFLGIGMTEVSTCDITVKQGEHVKKGDQLG